MKKRPAASVREWPDGPLDSEVFDWPDHILERLLSKPILKERLITALSGIDIHVTTDYSGMECPGEALRCNGMAVRSALGAECDIRPIHFRRCCDIADIPKAMLLAMHEDTVCVFPDLNARLPLEVRNMLDALEPEEGMSTEEHVAARQNQYKFLQSRKRDVFTRGATSWCERHGRECLTLPQPDEGHCRKGGGPSSSSPAGPLQKALRVHFAGACCQGWSSMGSRQMFAHPSERPHAIWVTERERAGQLDLEDLFILEQSPRYKWEDKLSNLSDTHELRRLLISPEMLGILSRRLRAYVIGISKISLQWIGASPERVQEEFDAIFRVALRASARAFMNAEMPEVEEFHRRRAELQGNFWPRDFAFEPAYRATLQHPEKKSDLLMECMGLNCFKRFEAYEAARSKAGLDQCFSDLQQNESYAAPVSSSMPVELRNTLVVSHVARRLLTPLEVLSQHGFHVHDKTAMKWGLSPVRGAIESAGVAAWQIGKVSGNGQSLPVVQAVWLYALTHTKVKHVQRSVPEIRLGRRGGTVFFDGGDGWSSSDESGGNASGDGAGAKKARLNCMASVVD